MSIERRSSRRSVALIISLLLAICALVVVNETSASAATTCSGSLIASKSIRDFTGPSGTLSVYYNSSTHRNCARATNTTGARQQMYLWIVRCAEGTGRTFQTCDNIDSFNGSGNSDSGRFISYAGPVNTAGNSAGLCIYAGVQMILPGGESRADIGGHCG